MPEPEGADPSSDFPGEVEMTLVDHLDELRNRVLRSLLAVVLGAAACLVFVKPLVKLLEVPAHGIRFLQLAPGEFLFVSIKVAGYAGLTLALPYVLYEVLAFVLPGLTRRERRLVAPAVAGSALLFAAGLAFAWWALVPAALAFLVNYGADVVEPSWSIERYLDFVLLLMVATALAFQLPVLQLLLPDLLPPLPPRRKRRLLQFLEMLLSYRTQFASVYLSHVHLQPLHSLLVEQKVT
jgi:sec-independent protein translocase protein TatC